MKSKLSRIVLLLIVSFSFVGLIGCTQEKPIKFYQERDTINHELVYHFQEASRHLDMIKKADRYSYLHVDDFWAEFGQLGNVTFDSFKVTEEKLEKLILATFEVAIKADVADLESGKFDGDHQIVADHIQFCVTHSGQTLADFGLTEVLLDDLVKTSAKAQGRRVAQELRQQMQLAEEKDDRIVNVQSYVDKLESLAMIVSGDSTSIEVFGITEQRLQDFLRFRFSSPGNESDDEPAE